MKTRNNILTTVVFFLIFFISCKPEGNGLAFEEQLATQGPDNGSLVIVGGAMRDTSIINRFIELAGGPETPLVVVPTASGAEEIRADRYVSFLKKQGAQNVTLLHTYDPETANTEKFVKPLKEAGGLWFTGGRQWRLVDAYEGTLAAEEFRNILTRGGVIGGSSAGATIQGSYLVRGDTKTNRIIMGDHEAGFGYLSNAAIDQHLLQRNRQFDLVEVIRKHPHLLGIGLDENTAIIVKGNEFEVMGKSFVAVYDYHTWEENPLSKKILPNGGTFFLLREGDKYNMTERKIIDLQGRGRDIFPEETEKETVEK